MITVKTKIHILRTKEEADNPYCSVPIITNVIEGVRVSEWKCWNSLSDLRGEETNPSGWGYLCRHMDENSTEAPLRAYNLVQVEDSKRIHVSQPGNLEGLIFLDGGAPDICLPLWKHDSKWVRQLRIFQLRHDNVTQVCGISPLYHSPRMHVACAIALTLSFVENRQDILPIILGAYNDLLVAKGRPRLGSNPGQWVLP